MFEHHQMNAPRIHAPRAVAPAVNMLKDFIKSRMSEGAEFSIGQTIQCAWMWFRVGTDERGQPTILAPRMGVMPMDFVPDCSDALNLVLTQRYLCDSFGVECDWCNAVQSAIVVKDLANCKGIFMERSEQENGRASGWFCGASDTKLDMNDVRNLELKSLWQLSCALPQSRDFFLLPKGWQVALEDRPIVLCDRKLVSARLNSYYLARYQS
jgi:hypothetical protein